MARPQPTIAVPTSLETRKDQEYITQVREYRLITPLFGGGVEPGEADPVTVVRASEVRGQLRFWWRATRGGQFGGKLEDMKAAEDLLWGAASKKEYERSSLVQVEVKILNNGFPVIPIHSDSQKPPFDLEHNRIPKEKLSDPKLALHLNGRTLYEQFDRRLNQIVFKELTVGSPESVYGYIAFPLREENGKPAGNLIEGVTFRLTLRYPRSWPDTLRNSKDFMDRFKNTRFSTSSAAEEIEAALWTWETLGGVGARTRRGCGAVSLERIVQGANSTLDIVAQSDTPEKTMPWLLEALLKIIPEENWCINVPHLSKTMAGEIGFKGKDSIYVWARMGQRLKEFRQRRNPGRKSSFGRSKWPEPDAVRKLRSMYFEDSRDPEHHHRDPVNPPLIEAFPRAAFGLPISFAFQRDQTNPARARKVDPTGTNTLEGDHKDHQRYTSPLILRPILCANQEYAGLAILLEGSELPPMQLEAHKGLIAKLTSSQARQLRHKGLPEIPDTGGDVLPRHILLAFLAFLKGK